MGKIIDLRSDTKTLPTESMRRAMAAAEVGDDVVREDPTVNKLEERAAEIFGKEAAVFVTSGTQGNAVSMLAHTKPGDMVYADYRSHVANFEAGGFAALPRAGIYPLRGDRGGINPQKGGAARH